MVDDFQRLCLHAGYSANIEEINALTTSETWWVAKIVHDNNIIKNKSSQNETIYDYIGSVYCLSVPSEVFYVRQNGIPCFTGNSRSGSGPIVLLTRQQLVSVVRVKSSSKSINWIIMFQLIGNTLKLREYSVYFQLPLLFGNR